MPRKIRNYNLDQTYCIVTEYWFLRTFSIGLDGKNREVPVNYGPKVYTEI